MRRQRNTAQVKKQITTAKKGLSKTELANLSDAEFITLVIRIVRQLTEYANSIKKTQTEMKVM